MTTRIGIELSRVACRIVELDPGMRGRSWGRAPSESRVVSCVSLPPDGASTAGRLSLFRGRRASVVVWGARTDHRQVVVTQGSYERMRVEARSRLRDAGLPTEGTLSDIAPAAPRVAGMDRRAVLLASASGAEVMAALAPLIAAGINIRSVLTPAAALQSLARARLAGASSDALEAYVALEEMGTCIAFVRGGVLLAARDLPWGFVDELSDVATPRERHDIALRLADEISAFLAACRFDGKPLSQVSVCGGLPELRSMTVPLMERLDVEVDALDSLFGIDATRLPEPADQFRERAAEMRLAWAVAADARPALDLFRRRRRRVSITYLSRAAVMAGAAAGLGVGWWTQSQWRPAGTPASAIVSIARVNVPPAPRQPALAPRVVPAPALFMKANAVPLPPPLAAFRGPESAALHPAGPDAPLMKAVIPPPIVTPRPFARSNEPMVLPVSRILPVARPVVFERPAPLTAQAVLPPRPVAVAPSTPAVSVAPAPRRAAQETALPFEASLGTILFGPDRALAIVDGRIVETGDEVHGARVVEITSSAVILRDAQGKLRRLSLSTNR